MVNSDNKMESEQEPVPTTARNQPQYPNNMQSTEKQGAKVKTLKKDPPHHFIKTNNGKDCDIVTVNKEDYDAITRGHPPKRTLTSERSAATKTVDHRPQTTRRSYAGTITGITFFPEQEPPSTSQAPQLTGRAITESRKEIPWTPKQFYDVKGNPDYQMNSHGIVLT